MRGFLAVMDDLPEVEGPLRHACEYVHRQIRPDGKVLTPFLDSWRLPDGSVFSEYTNLYVLPPLLEAGRRLSVPRYTEASQRAMDYFKRKPDLVDFKPRMSTLSHIFGYMMGALVEMGELELARKGLSQAAEIQRPDGSIPAYPGARWVCSTGMAQLAVAWYRLGNLDPANKAMGYLEKLQESDGGFHGSYGPGAKYFPKNEISWAIKFFIDAYLLKIKTDFNREVSRYSEELDENDGRARTILSFLSDLNKKKVIDIGCGKGRYLRILQKAFPEADLYGIDLSEEMLHFCPKGVKTTVGTMLNIRNSNNFFDCVYSVEALEHAVAIEPAIQEMVRVLKPGGRIVVIDKNAAKLGVMGIKSWERWFDPEQIVKLLKKYGVDAHYKLVSYDEHSQPDGLFVAWEGTKNA
jgi:malonyl-CoA O-methyltransferase